MEDNIPYINNQLLTTNIYISPSELNNDIDTTINPFEAGLGFCVNMDKGDFIGREALVNKDKRTCLLGLTCKTETPVSGSKVINGSKIVG